MKIEFEIKDYESFLTAINHAIVAYNAKVYQPIFFGMTDDLPSPFYKAWIENKKLDIDSIFNITKKDLKILNDFYNKLEGTKE